MRKGNSRVASTKFLPNIARIFPSTDVAMLPIMALNGYQLTDGSAVIPFVLEGRGRS